MIDKIVSFFLILQINKAKYYNKNTYQMEKLRITLTMYMFLYKKKKHYNFKTFQITNRINLFVYTVYM